jgi:hypothetical protein
MDKIMNASFPGFTGTLIIGTGIMLLVLCGMIAWTTRTGFRRRKLEAPKFGVLFLVAFLQVLLGGLTIFSARAFSDNPWLCIGTGLGILILAGLIFIKTILKQGWKDSLRVWAVAGGMQLVLVPLCAGILVVGLLMLTFSLYPPLL